MSAVKNLPTNRLRVCLEGLAYLVEGAAMVQVEFFEQCSQVFWGENTALFGAIQHFEGGNITSHA